MSTNGTTWTSLWSNGTSEIADAAWTTVEYDLAAIADNQPTVYVRWGYQVTSGAYAYSGWNIDDVEFLGTYGAPVITSPASVLSVVNRPFSHQLTTSHPATSFSSGALPSGLTLNTSTGLISGTPTAEGFSRVLLTATNDNGSATQLLAISIVSPLPLITSPDAVNGLAAQAFSHQITTSYPATSFSSATLPAGLTLNTATGLISGTPTTGGSGQFQITAFNVDGSDSQLLTISIAGTGDTTYVVTAADRGWYDGGGVHTTTNTNYLTGYNGAGNYRSFFVFGIPSLPPGATITSAELRLGNPSNGYISVDASETLQFHQVTTSIATLIAGTGGLAAFTDLGEGTSYTTKPVSLADNGTTVVIPLNTAFLSSAAATAGSQIALGGRIATLTSTVDTNERMFSSTGDTFSTQLALTVLLPPGSAPNMVVQQPEGTDLASGSASVDFGTVLAPARSVRRFLIRNTGNLDLTLGNRTVTGPQASEFTLGTPTATTLVAGATTFLDVTFAPGAPGTRAATLTIASNDPDTPSFVITLTGTGASVGGGVELVSDISSAAAGLNPFNAFSMGSYVLFYATTPLQGTELWRSDGTAAGTYLLKDINPGPSGSTSTPLARIGSLAYFTGTTTAEGTELWVTDGTVAGTQMVSDIATGFTSSAPTSLTAVGTTLYFSASTTSAGRELWKSNGTEAGTVLVSDINIGTSSSSPTGFTNLDGTILFNATTATAGPELWKTDGTAGGTQMVLETYAGTSHSGPINLTVVGSTLFFVAPTPTNGFELWKSDGTAGGTAMVKDIEAGSTSSNPNNLISTGGVLYFSATTTASGLELWRSDGSSAGTTQVKDINPGTTGSSFASPIVYGGRLYFSANGGVSGSELWTSDGTDAGTVMLVDIYAGSFASTPQNFRIVGSTLFFSAFSPLGRELWKTDGTALGTVQVRDIAPGSGTAVPVQLVDMNGVLLFAANDGATGQELWRSDGTTAGTVPVGDMVTGSSSSTFGQLRNVNGTLYFGGNDNVNGTELWRSGGISSNTLMVKDINSLSSSSFPNEMTAIGTNLIFAAITSTSGTELMVSDGTSAGTNLLLDIFSGFSSSSPANFVTLGSQAYFSANNGTAGTELWKTDGTAVGTAQLVDILSGASSSSPSFLFNYKGNLYFRATDSTTGSELWFSDGTAMGTRRVKDINTGGSNSSPANFTVMNGDLYFTATTAADGAELWRTDGTEAGTTQVASIFAGASASNPSSLTAVGSTLFFAATGSASTGNELWKSDGTSGGTVLVKDIRSGSFSSTAFSLVAMGGALYFTADDGLNGRELWKSDGTTAGTVLLKDILSGSGSSSPSQLVRMGNVLYFTADDGVNGRELWKSDGTTGGTVLASDLYAGSVSSQATALTAVGSRLFFTGVHPSTGTELFNVVETAPAQMLASYPAGTPQASAASALDFGTVSIGASKTYTLTLENRGTNRLAISSYSITGRDAAEFQARSLSQSVLFGNDIANLEVVFNRASVGRKVATLHLFSDDPSVPDYTIGLETPKLDQTITFPEISDQLATSTVALSATGGASGNPVTFSVSSGPGVISGGNSLTFSGAGQVTILASQAGNEDYNPASDVVRTFAVTKANASVALVGLSQTYDGTARTVSATTVPPGLTVDLTYDGGAQAPVAAGSYAISGTVNDARYQGSSTGTLVVAKAAQAIAFAAIPDQLATATVSLSATGGGSGSPVTVVVTSGPGVIAGASLTFTTAGQVSITASQAGNANHQAAPDVIHTFAVTKTNATITLVGLSQTYDGTARAVSATTVPPGLTVDLTYDGGAQAPVDAGSYAISGTVNDARYQGSSTGTLVVAKASQVISFAVIPDQLANATLNLTATGGGSGNAVTLAVTSGPGVLADGNSLTFTAAGQVTITASQTGNGNYEAAPDVIRTFAVTKASATITLAGLSQTYDGSARTVSATTVPPGLTVDLTYDGGGQAPVAAGSYAISGTVNDARYQGSSTGTLVVAKAAQAIAFAAIPDQLATATVSLSATGGGSGIPVTFAVTSGPGVITGDSLTFTTAGQVSITASQVGNANYEAPPDVIRTFTVTKAEATLTLGGLSQTYDGTARTVSATTVPAGKVVVISYDGAPEAPAGAGSYAVTATIDDPIYQASATGTLVVAKAGQAINFPSIPNQVATATVPLSAAGGGSGNPVTFAVTAGPATISGGNVLSFTGAGQVSVTASEEGNANYEAAPAVTRSFTVSRAMSVVGLSGLYQAPNGTPVSVTTVTNPPGLTVLVTYDGGGAAPAAPGSYAVVATVDEALYQGSATGTLVLDPRAGKHLDDVEAEVESPEGVDIAWNTDGVGVYDGLLRDATDGETIVGVVSALKVSAPPTGSVLGGAVSGTVRLKNASATLRGSMDSSGQLSLTSSQRSGGDLVVDLQLIRTEPVQPGQSSNGEALRGTITWNGLVTRADLLRAPFHAKNNPLLESVAKVGTYTFLLPSEPGWGDDEPGGDGWATATLDAAGVLKLTGKLGDGSAFTETAYLSAHGQAHVFAELYASSPGKGLIGGRISFRDLEEISDCDGVFQWLKGEDTRIPPRELLYAGGFRRSVGAIGSVFVPPVAGQRVLTQLQNQYHNAELSLIGPTAPLADSGSLDRVLSWLPNNTLMHYGQQKLSGSASAKTGSVTGSFLDPTSNRSVAFTGAAFQKQGLVGGVFSWAGSAGAVRILPGTMFTYPGSEAPPVLARIRKPGTPAAARSTSGSVLEAAAAGLFHGMLVSANEVTGAVENLRLTAAGAVSGTLWIQGKSYTIRGSLLPDGSLALLISRGLTLTPIDFRLVLTKGDGSDFGFEGSATVDGVTHTLVAHRQPLYTKLNPALEGGAYTMVVCAPDGIDPAVEPGGDGYGTVSVSYLGNCTGLVTLADGTKVTLAGFVGRRYDDAGTPTAEWTFHRGLYGRVPQGFVAGRLTFRENAGGLTDLDGEWRWEKVSGAAPIAIYPSGFAVTRPVAGSRYTAPLTGSRAVAGLDALVDNVWLRFAGPALSASVDEDFDRVATWTEANKLVYPGPEKITLTFNAKTGLLTGSCVDTLNGINVRFGGVLLQDQDLVSGSYLLKTQSGLFIIQER